MSFHNHPIMKSEKFQKVLFRAIDAHENCITKTRALTLALSFLCSYKLTEPSKIMSINCEYHIAQGNIVFVDKDKFHVPLNGCIDNITVSMCSWHGCPKWESNLNLGIFIFQDACVHIIFPRLKQLRANS